MLNSKKFQLFYIVLLIYALYFDFFRMGRTTL